MLTETEIEGRGGGMDVRRCDAGAANPRAVPAVLELDPVTVPKPAPVEARSAYVCPASVARRFLATVLFVDVVDSTRRAIELGDARWLAIQEEHETMVRREIRRYGGRCLTALGDGLVASFGSAAGAVRCGATIAEASRSLGIDVRAGVHSGECERRGARLGGIVFHVGARLVVMAAPGEVLVSRTVTELVSGAGFVFGRRGTHRLKGLPGEWPLYAFLGRRTRDGERRERAR